MIFCDPDDLLIVAAPDDPLYDPRAELPMKEADVRNVARFGIIEPIIGQLAASQLNIGALIPAGTVITDSCFIDTFLGCLGSARVTIANPPPSYGSLSFNADSKTNVVGADITIHNIRIDVDIHGSGLVPTCGMRLTANALLVPSFTR